MVSQTSIIYFFYKKIIRYYALLADMLPGVYNLGGTKKVIEDSPLETLLYRSSTVYFIFRKFEPAIRYNSLPNDRVKIAGISPPAKSDEHSPENQILATKYCKSRLTCD